MYFNDQIKFLLQRGELIKVKPLPPEPDHWVHLPRYDLLSPTPWQVFQLSTFSSRCLWLLLSEGKAGLPRDAKCLPVFDISSKAKHAGETSD